MLSCRKFPVPNFTEIRPVRAALIHSDRRTKLMMFFAAVLTYVNVSLLVITFCWWLMANEVVSDVAVHSVTKELERVAVPIH